MPSDCPICLDTPRNPAMTPCTHVFCRRCIRSWLDNHPACPVCRHPIRGRSSALTTVAAGSSTPVRRAASMPARSPQAPRVVRVVSRARAQAAAAANLAAGRASTSNASTSATASRRSATSTASTSRRPTTSTTYRGTRSHFSRCMYACTLAERRAFRNHGVPCSCMRVQDRESRLSAVDAPAATSTPVTQSHSAPTSRNNSSSSEGSSDNSFQSQMERALIASVEVASAEVVRSSASSPLDEATRRAIAQSLAEGNAALSRTLAETNAALTSTATVTWTATVPSATTSTATSRQRPTARRDAQSSAATEHPDQNDPFLAALNAALSGVDEENDAQLAPISEGEVEDLPAPLPARAARAVMNGLSALGLPLLTRRSFARSMGYRLHGDTDADEDGEVADCQILVSIKDVCDTLTNQRWNDLNIAFVRRALRRIAFE